MGVGLDSWPVEGQTECHIRLHQPPVAQVFSASSSPVVQMDTPPFILLLTDA